MVKPIENSSENNNSDNLWMGAANGRTHSNESSDIRTLPFIGHTHTTIDAEIRLLLADVIHLQVGMGGIGKCIIY